MEHPPMIHNFLDTLFITILYTCHVTEVVYHRGEQLHIRKKIKLYIAL